MNSTVARKKVLVVDDSKTALLMECMVLKQLSMDVVTANDGMEALAVAERERPDLILLDVVMPRMDGFETLKKLRSAAATSATPIVMVTTRSELPNVERGFEFGCSDYVTKPVDSMELLGKIRALLKD